MIHSKNIMDTRIDVFLTEYLLLSNNANYSISTYPLNDYILTSLLLKMTGTLEQKIDNILWEIGTEFPDVRYNIIHGSKRLSSSSEAINNVYSIQNDVIEKIKNEKDTKDIWKRKEEFIKTCFNIYKMFSKAKFLSVNNIAFKEFKRTFMTMYMYDFFKQKKEKNNHMASWYGKYMENAGKKKNELDIKKIYENVIKIRNEKAHNVVHHPYFPSLDVLSHKNKSNFFINVSVLVFIDNVFTEKRSIYNSAVSRYVL